MVKSIQIKKDHFFLATALLLSTIAVKQLVVPAILILIVSWLLNEPFQQKLKSFKEKPLILLLLIPFISYLIGMIYSDNQYFGWKDIEVKMSLFLFPIIYGTSTYHLNKHQGKLALIYIYSSCMVGLLSFIWGWLEYQQVPTYEMMDLFLHPGYLSMYLNLALLFVFWSAHQEDSLINRPTVLLLFFVLSSLIFLCLSKTGILIWLILLSTYADYRFVILTRQYLYLILLTLFAGILLLTAYFTIPAVKERFYWGISAFTSEQEVDLSTTESSRVRILIWEQAIQLVKDKPLLGTGTGDIKDDLFVKYQAEGMTGALENKLNVHNQFLQVLATLGMIAFLLFLIAMFYPPLKSLHLGSGLFLGFTLIFAINLLAESMLEKQAGVIFYAFFNSLICFHFASLKSLKWSSK